MKAHRAILSLALLAACAKDATAPLPPVTTVSIQPPASTSFYVGDSTIMTAAVRGTNGSVLTSRAVTWASSDPTVATVRPAGTVAAMIRAMKPGNVTITATSEGKRGTIDVLVTGPVASVVVSLSVSTIPVGGSAQITVVARDANNNLVAGRKVTYASSNIGVATASSAGPVGTVPGTVFGVGLGTAIVSATMEGKSGEATITVVPSPPPPGAQHAFRWTAADGLTDLGVLPDFIGSMAASINASGQIVGSSYRIDGNSARFHAVRWSPTGVPQDLGTLPGGRNSSASAINNLGQVVGSASTGMSTDAPSHAVLWSPTGVIRDLGTLAGDQGSSASGINDAGQVVGVSYTRGGPVRAFAWTEAGGMVDLLNTFTSGYGYAAGVNRSGAITGTRGPMAGAGNGKPFRLSQAGTLENLAIVSGDSSGLAHAINDATDVAGTSFGATIVHDDYYGDYLVEVPHAVLWTAAGGLVNLSILPGFDRADSEALGLNNRGLVVGRSGRRAFAWTQLGGFVDIGVLPLRGWSVAIGVNDAGQVVGYSWGAARVLANISQGRQLRASRAER